MIFEQLKKTLVSGSYLKNYFESLFEFDFKMTSDRAAFMRLCFSPLASWYVLIILGIFYISPFRYQLSFLNVLGADHFISETLFLNNQFGLIVFFAVLIFVQWFLRIEEVLTLFIGFLVSNGDIHLSLALLSLFLIRFVRILYQFKFVRNLQSLTKVLYSVSGLILALSYCLSFYLCFYLYQYLANEGYFSFSVFKNRFEFYILTWMIVEFCDFFLLSLWGHFYNKRIQLSEQIRVFYASAIIIKKIKLSQKFKINLSQRIADLLIEKQRFTQADLDLLPKRLVEFHKQEEKFLQDAQTCLNS